MLLPYLISECIQVVLLQSETGHEPLLSELMIDCFGPVWAEYKQVKMSRGGGYNVSLQGQGTKNLSQQVIR